MKKETNAENTEQYDALDILLFDFFKTYDPFEREFASLKLTEKPLVISHRHKIFMNRLFHKKVGKSFLPFPEADTSFEKARNRFVLSVEQIKEKYENKKI